jgi:hypothetical protein
MKPGRGAKPVLFPVVSAPDWNDPRLRQLGEQFAAEAYTLADELNSYGADASQLLLPQEKQRTDRPWSVDIPPRYADVLHALLLSLSRPGERGRRSRWSKHRVEAMIDSGITVAAAAKAEAAATGQSATSIERTVRAWRARNKRE